MNDLLEVAVLVDAIRRDLMRLALMSHAPAQSFNPAPPPEDVKVPPAWRFNNRRDPVPHLGSHHAKGGSSSGIPSGGIDRRGDFIEEYRQKSHLPFVRKLGRLQARASSTADDYRALLKEVRAVVWDWAHTPEMRGAEQLERGTFYWKCAIADDDRPVAKVKEVWCVSERTVYRYRAKFRGLRVPQA